MNIFYNNEVCSGIYVYVITHVELYIKEDFYIVGRIPMRHLVYRVQPLPQSMLPLVWDFGQLDSSVEKLYIIQMVQRYVCIIQYLCFFFCFITSTYINSRQTTYVFDVK